jgi:hypothetical protein
VENLSGSDEQQGGQAEAVAQEADSRSDVQITELDRQHLQAFPSERKAALLERIRAREPDKSIQLEGKTDFERTLRRLRRDGYALIDLQLHETAFSSMWYRKSDGVRDWRRMEVTMVIWALLEHGPATTVQTWLL